MEQTVIEVLILQALQQTFPQNDYLDPDHHRNIDRDDAVYPKVHGLDLHDIHDPEVHDVIMDHPATIVVHHDIDPVHVADRVADTVPVHVVVRVDGMAEEEEDDMVRVEEVDMAEEDVIIEIVIGMVLGDMAVEDRVETMDVIKGRGFIAVNDVSIAERWGIGLEVGLYQII